MDKHTITVQDILNYEYTQQLAGNFGSKQPNKGLIAHIKGDTVKFEVVTEGKNTMTSSLCRAVSIYNAA